MKKNLKLCSFLSCRRETDGPSLFDEPVLIELAKQKGKTVAQVIFVQLWTCTKEINSFIHLSIIPRNLLCYLVLNLVINKS